MNKKKRETEADIWNSTTQRVRAKNAGTVIKEEEKQRKVNAMVESLSSSDRKI